jgi:PhnB protein
MAASPIPEGYHSANPTLALHDANEAIEFYKRAFGAKERVRMPTPDGRIAHAELEIGDSILMLADTFEHSTARPPKELGGTTAGVMLYVEDVDAVVQQAVDAGATVTMPVEDPFGHAWSIATHKEDLSGEEVRARAEEAMAGLT